MTENVPEGPQGDAAVWFGLTPPSTWTDSQWDRTLKLIRSVEMENNGGDSARANELVRHVAELRGHEHVDERLGELLFPDDVDGPPGSR
ncbi:hypothetical protein I3U63_23150 [Mycobacteroides abscessus subsp. massiliense]|uniref:hypothetical protein n=1 Tax=Mycobacteroides abscessus TaxID=36809 RepID=UPI0012FFE476|nr:hypothetical protein [Mycobacteroides abscessus]MBN7324415.1 hypothetical protein [Mycobacteroides abscessus subsp. massiliense]